MNTVFLLKMGEMILKGLNRQKFESALMNALRAVLAPHGAFALSACQSVVYAEPTAPCDLDAVEAALMRVFGVVSVCRAVKCEKSLDAIAAAAVGLPGLDTVCTFKVEAKRSDKRFPQKSPEICREIGAVLLEAYNDPTSSVLPLHAKKLTVDVHHPEETVWVEVREQAAYVHTAPKPGAGGLPAGVSGRAMLLLSGGIDSPVAGWRMARRGLALEAVHFESYPYTSPEARQKVEDLAARLARWTGKIPLHVVSFTKIQERIRDCGQEALATLLTRRSMMRIASALAERANASALITGDSLGQVASQTMASLAVVEDAASLPVLRPLIGLDKEEISVTARHIGTFETSILPYEDCCGVFTPKHPQTKPTLAAILRSEERCDLAALEENAIDG